MAIFSIDVLQLASSSNNNNNNATRRSSNRRARRNRHINRNRLARASNVSANTSPPSAHADATTSSANQESEAPQRPIPLARRSLLVGWPGIWSAEGYPVYQRVHAEAEICRQALQGRPEQHSTSKEAERPTSPPPECSTAEESPLTSDELKKSLTPEEEDKFPTPEEDEDAATSEEDEKSPTPDNDEKSFTPEEEEVEKSPTSEDSAEDRALQHLEAKMGEAASWVDELTTEPDKVKTAEAADDTGDEDDGIVPVDSSLVENVRYKLMRAALGLEDGYVVPYKWFHNVLRLSEEEVACYLEQLHIKDD